MNVNIGSVLRYGQSKSYKSLFKYKFIRVTVLRITAVILPDYHHQEVVIAEEL